MIRRCLFFLFFLTSIALSPFSKASFVEGLSAQDLITLKGFFESIPRASSLVVHEGLPHPGWEQDLFKAEMANKEVIRIHDYPFYKRPLEIAAADVEALRILSAEQSNLIHSRGRKMCGGYHPDYCLTWKAGETTYHMLLCLGCSEAKIFGPGVEWYGDIFRGRHPKFQKLLIKYRWQRPAKQLPKAAPVQTAHHARQCVKVAL